MRQRVLITGAAGNLGGLLAHHLQPSDHRLRLMVHHRPVAVELRDADNVEVITADLARPETLTLACHEVDSVVHFARVLFRPWPERFLRQTNVGYFQNLVEAALAAGVGKIILISFPHVEGETAPEHRATGRLDGHPTSVHARTRLEEERYLLSHCEGTQTTPVVLRVGMVYGPGVLMIEAARWLLQRRLLPVWPGPTGVHLIATPDAMAAIQAAIDKPEVRGIYHLGDEQPLTLQEFFDRLAAVWGYAPPCRLPLPLFYLAALGVEAFATIFHTPAPLHRDFIRIGSASYCGDTSRMHRELMQQLQYPTLTEGLTLFPEA